MFYHPIIYLDIYVYIETTRGSCELRIRMAVRTDVTLELATEEESRSNSEGKKIRNNHVDSSKVPKLVQSITPSTEM